MITALLATFWCVLLGLANLSVRHVWLKRGRRGLAYVMLAAAVVCFGAAIVNGFMVIVKITQ